MLRMIERLLGGTGVDEGARPRELTEIETALARRIFDHRARAAVDRPGTSCSASTLALLGVESQLANVQLAPPSEPTLTMTMELQLAELSSTISLLVPHRAIEPVSTRLSAGQYGDTDVEPGATEAERRPASPPVDVEVRAEVGRDRADDRRGARAASPATSSASASPAAAA